jgi:hypothetical protein
LTTGVIQAQFSLFRELKESGGGGHHFGEGGDVEEGVQGHGLPPGGIGALAESLMEDDFPPMADQDDGSRGLPRPDRLFRDRRNSGKLLGLEDLRKSGNRPNQAGDQQA